MMQESNPEIKTAGCTVEISADGYLRLTAAVAQAIFRKMCSSLL